MQSKDLRLIEAGFPCHQVGAETQRERGASSALPPLYFLHVWWARRPLTPSRAAILASLLPADTDPDWFLRQLGMEKRVVKINGQQWTLTGKILDKVEIVENGQEVLEIDGTVQKYIIKENKARQEIKQFLITCLGDDRLFAFSNIISKWMEDVGTLAIPEYGTLFEVQKIAADPAFSNDKRH